MYRIFYLELNLNIMIELEKSSRLTEDEIEFLFKYFGQNDPTNKYQWTGTVFIGQENGETILTAPVEQYDENGIIETIDWISIPVPPEFQ